MIPYLQNVLLGFDYFANSLRGGRPNETVSMAAALARAQGKEWGCALCAVLDWLQKDHCVNAIKGEAARVELVEHDAGEPT